LYIHHFIFIGLSDTDCGDLYKGGQKEPGVYKIRISDESQPEIYCMEEGWTVIQSRGQFGNPEDYFYNGWDDYVAGFGTPGQEQWLGLNNIFDMTDKKSYQLRITMEDFNRTKKVGFYDTFNLMDRVRMIEGHAST
jgi:ficolin